jgi:hypothetical protein
MYPIHRLHRMRMLHLVPAFLCGERATRMHMRGMPEGCSSVCTALTADLNRVCPTLGDALRPRCWSASNGQYVRSSPIHARRVLIMHLESLRLPENSAFYRSILTLSRHARAFFYWGEYGHVTLSHASGPRNSVTIFVATERLVDLATTVNRLMVRCRS